MAFDPDKTHSAQRVLIVGISGYLGSALAVGLRDAFEVYGTYFKNPIRIEGCTAMPMDATNSNEILEILQLVQPDVVLYCAGIRNLQVAEADPASAEALNFKAPSIFFKLLRTKTHFIYFNEDRVFDAKTAEENNPILETVNPLVSHMASVFTKSKVQGETVVRANRYHSHAFRIGALYGETMGSALHLKNNWLSTGIGGLQQSQPQIFLDEVSRSFTYIGDVIRSMRLFLKRMPTASAVYHLSQAAVPLSHYDLAQMVAEKMGFEKNLVRPQKYVKNAHGAEWGPPICLMSAEKFETYADFKFSTPDEGVSEMVERYRVGYTGGWR